MKTLRSDKHHVPAQELLPYLVCGAATTAVNYIMYGILLLLHIHGPRPTAPPGPAPS